jgi:hypothetical protein
LVYFTTLDEKADVMTEYKQFNNLERTLQGAVKVAIFRMDPKSEGFTKLKKEFKAGTLNEGKPVIRFYPNELKGDLKN